MAKKNEIIVKDVVIKTIKKTADYIRITDIARQKNTTEPKFAPLIIGELTIHHLNQLLYTDDGMYALGQIRHIQQYKNPIITTHWACMDCRRAFKLSQLP